MAIIERNRVVRESSRKPTSSYKVDTKKVGLTDTLIVNIFHETSSFRKTYRFSGVEISGKNSIHFKAFKSGNGWEIKWIGV